MDPVTLVVSALVAGSAAALKETATAAVTEAYRGLRELVRQRLAERRGAEVVLDRHETEPSLWEGPLRSELTAVGITADEDVLRAARSLLTLLDPKGAGEGRFDTAIAGDVQGFVQGDHNNVTMTFGSRDQAER
jgi:hypothetical protein